MRVFISGATGVIGRRAVAKFVAAGHDVTGLSRSESNDALLDKFGARPQRGDLFEPDSLAHALADQEIVVNLATNIPPSSRAFKRKAWAMNDRIRIEGSANLVEAATTAGARRFIQESITLAYPDCGSKWINETIDLSPSPATRCVLDAEENARQFASSTGTGVILRFGAFYARDAEHSETYLAMARKGIAPLMGPASAYQSVIHADDAASALLSALGCESGTYNVVDDEPLMRGDANGLIAASIGRKRLLKPPNWLMTMLGGQTARLLMRSQRVSNANFRHAADWKPEFSSMRSGWPLLATQALSQSLADDGNR